MQDSSIEMERASGIVWRNILEDPLMSRVTSHIFCAYRNTFRSEWTCPNVKTHYARLYYVISGEAVIYPNEDAVHLQPGFSYLIPSNILFRHECRSAITLYWCHFQIIWDSFSELFDHLRAPIAVRTDSIETHRGWFDQLAGLMQSGNMASYLLRSALLYQLLIPHLREAEPKTESALQDYHRFLPVIKYIDEHLSSTIRVEVLARLLGLHPEYFSRYFRKVHKVPPRQYILQRRIWHAQCLLSQRDLQIQEVGERCGFPDRYYFSKLFRQYVGVTPSNYRKAH
jgi:AraC-like DNA-binding protein